MQAAVEVTVGVAAVEQRVARGCERRVLGSRPDCLLNADLGMWTNPPVGVGQIIAEGCFPWRGTVGPGEASRSSGGRVLGSLCKRRGAALGAATSPTDARLGLMFEVAHGRGGGESRRSQRRWETALTGTHGFPGGTLGSTSGFGRPSAGRSEADLDAARPADGQAAVNDGPGGVRVPRSPARRRACCSCLKPTGGPEAGREVLGGNSNPTTERVYLRLVVQGGASVRIAAEISGSRETTVPSSTVVWDRSVIELVTLR